MRKMPMVWLAVAYAAGIVLGRVWFFSWEITVVLAAASGVFYFLNKEWGKNIAFYVLVVCLGYGMYYLSQGLPMFEPKLQLLPLRRAIRTAVFYNFPSGAERDLMAGLFLGERTRVAFSLVEVFRNTNTIHILAISGLHVGCIGLMLLFSLRLLCVPRKIAALIAIVGVILYVFVVGWRPPAFRATVMFVVLLGGWLINRPANTVNSLFFAALLILIVSPAALFNAGFQLSFVVVLSLLLLVPVVAGSQEIPLPRRYLQQAVAGCLVAWVGALPLVAYHFQVVSPLSIVANLFVVPLITLIIASGFGGIILGQIYLPVSGVFNAVSYYLLKSLISFVKAVAKVPGCYFRVREVALWMVFLYYLVLGIVLFLPELSKLIGKAKSQRHNMKTL